MNDEMMNIVFVMRPTATDVYGNGATSTMTYCYGIYGTGRFRNNRIVNVHAE